MPHKRSSATARPRRSKPPKIQPPAPSPRPAELLQKWAAELSLKWGRPVPADGCPHCLETAYYAVMDDRSGYVTDEDLIEASGNTLYHK